MATDLSDNLVLLYGGAARLIEDHIALNYYTWTYQNGHWANISPTISVSPRQAYMSDAVSDPADHGVLYYGGITRYGAGAFTWIFHDGSWTNESSTAGTPGGNFIYGDLAYDGADNVPLYIGGANDMDELGSMAAVPTWAYQNGAWINWTSATGYVDMEESIPMSAEDGNGGVLLLGGVIALYNFETWDLAPPLSLDATVMPTAVDVNHAVSFNSDVAGGIPPISISWTYGDGGSSSLNLTTHSYATVGNYVATFQATDLLGQEVYKSFAITVSSELSALAEAGPKATDVGQPVSFVGTVSGGAGPYTFRWVYGDGTTDTVQNSSHTYSTAGVYQVHFIVNDSAGESAESNATITINAIPTMVVSASTTSSLAGQNVSFTAKITGGTSPFTYYWNFSDGSGSSAASPTHAFASLGTYKVWLEVIDGGGFLGIEPVGSVTGSVTVVVLAPVSAQITTTQGGVATGSPVTFSATASGGAGGYTYGWNFGDGGTGTGSSVTHIYNGTGNYPVKLTVVDSKGNTATETIYVTVYSPSTSSSGWPTSAWVAVVALVVVLAVVVALMFILRRKPQAPYASPSPPPQAAAPPPPVAVPPPAPQAPPPPPPPPGG
jgi:PKD repeat protein